MDRPATDRVFRHEALLYAGLDGFLAGVVPFVRAGVEHAEPVAVVVGRAKTRALTEALGDDAAHVRFADMEVVGRNPGRLISFWDDFVREFGPAERPVRGVGEPVSPARGPDELVECSRHEALLNVAFRDSPWSLLCPYDVDALTADVIAEARATHPLLLEHGAHRRSPELRTLEELATPPDTPLDPPPVTATIVAFHDRDSLHAARRAATRAARAAGCTATVTNDVDLVVGELGANTIRHTTSGRGALCVWPDAEWLVCEVRDDGWISEPLAGRVRPSVDALNGRGLWLAHQLSDLVQLRTGPGRSVVRVRFSHAARDASSPGPLRRGGPSELSGR